jgi:hypothetical protein
MSSDRIRELEAEVARLSRLLRTYGYVEPAPVDAPTEKDIDALIAIIRGRYPWLVDLPDAVTFRSQFSRALTFFSRVHRAERPNTSYALSYWVNFARREWFSKQALAAAMTDNAFVAAAVASRIGHEPLDPRSCGSANLAIGEAFAGQPSAAWRETLKHGVPEPVEPRLPRQETRFIQTSVVEGLR